MGSEWGHLGQRTTSRTGRPSSLTSLEGGSHSRLYREGSRREEGLEGDSLGSEAQSWCLSGLEPASWRERDPIHEAELRLRVSPAPHK